MLIEKFKAGNYEKGYDYSYFVPTTINRNWNWRDSELSSLLEKASISLGELNSYGRLVPNISVFIQLYVKKEAVISSRIEGTQTGMNEALLPEEEISSEKRDDWREVQNYSRAMNEALEWLNELPLSSRLIKKVHSILLEGVRGKHKLPGEFRRSQNWIGGATLNDAVFIPPAHHLVNDLMSDLERFIYNRDISVPDLIKIGIIHYQFETIHPFLDGNGRIGRLLIPLYMVQKNILNKPLLYLSEFFEKDRTLYYENLMKVRKEDNLLHWLKYFLIGVEKTSKRASNVLNDILKLKEDTEKLIRKEAGRRADSAMILLSELFKYPVVKVNDVIRICDLSKKSANNLVKFMTDVGVLTEITGKERNKIFLFENYIELFK
jgi:Fic family protein